MKTERYCFHGRGLCYCCDDRLGFGFFGVFGSGFSGSGLVVSSSLADGIDEPGSMDAAVAKPPLNEKDSAKAHASRRCG
jgi:hypothetical protein